MKYFLCLSFLLLSIVTNGQSHATLPDDVINSIKKRIDGGLNPGIVIGIIDKEGQHYFNFGKKGNERSAPDEHTIYEIGAITKIFTAIAYTQPPNDVDLKNMSVTYESLVVNGTTSLLGMKETKITLDEKMKNNQAIGNFNGTEIGKRDPSGEIWSSAYDMLKFLSANLGLTPTPLQPTMNEIYTWSQTLRWIAWQISKGKNGNVMYHSGKSWGYRTFVGFVKETGKGVVVLTNSTEDIEDIGLHLLNPELKLRPIKQSMAFELRKTIDSNGIEAAKNHFYDLKKNRPDDYDFSEGAINRLGYSYMEKNVHAALAIFKINVEMYPNSSNVYNSYGESLLKNGQQDLAIENYKKSVELNPGNRNGVMALEKIGVKTEPKQIPEAILETYTGIYEFNPSFCIVIAREGKQLFSQGNSQGKFEIFAKTEKEFFTSFNETIFNTKGKKGIVKSLTIIQDGKKYNLKKIK